MIKGYNGALLYSTKALIVNGKNDVRNPDKFLKLLKFLDHRIILIASLASLILLFRF
jgi:hypothetical protein